MLRPHFLLSLLIVLPLFATELVEVPCAEYKLLTGRDFCDVQPVLKWERSKYEWAKRNRVIGECMEAVFSKYTGYGVKRTSKGGWYPDPKPDRVAVKDCVSCGPVRRTICHESQGCGDELEACVERHAAPPKKKAEPKEKVKLF